MLTMTPPDYDDQVVLMMMVMTFEDNSVVQATTAVTRGHFDAWSTDQESPIVGPL